MYLLSQFCSIKPPQKPDYSGIYTSPNYKVETQGECDQGSYIEMYIPEKPYYSDTGAKIAVIYLHGFTLGASEIYSTHLEHLVKQGYYVFYPNYQRGFCKFPAYRFETLYELVVETLNPFPISPVGWMESAISSTLQAFKYLNLTESNVNTYLFGHSLGGLFALSWCYYAQEKVHPNLLPKQIVVADPIPDSQSNIPPSIREYIDLFHGFKDKVDIVQTGIALKVPVAILHGNNDTIVPKHSWIKPFYSIETNQKTMYLSFTDKHGSPAMYADHEQATINTSFLSNWIADEFLGGVGVENNLDWRYIWHALDQVIRFGADADKLKFDMGKWSDGKPVMPIQVYLHSVNNSSLTSHARAFYSNKI
ncbi:alpha/beta hydrolase [Nostoc sphaeroides CHAB 2801]|uniref:alpha/beta hydrolase n=1 Tax=Nostoc sphaeroides TaxID=446679 RepID=UPI001E5DCDA6|nr:alpha/beta hydrolase [Nostoc sphaeroides]MCC5634088.1 alpha/beta hydrolase [Nostoc sphaeroides CHAB 2801]